MFCCKTSYRLFPPSCWPISALCLRRSSSSCCTRSHSSSLFTGSSFVPADTNPDDMSIQARRIFELKWLRFWVLVSSSNSGKDVCDDADCGASNYPVGVSQSQQRNKWIHLCYVLCTMYYVCIYTELSVEIIMYE